MRLYNIVPLEENNPLASKSQRARSCMLCTSGFATQAIIRAFVHGVPGLS
jgi:hypothetical protein